MHFADHFSDLGSAVDLLCVSVCSYDCFRTKWPLTWILASSWPVQIRFEGQGHRSKFTVIWGKNSRKKTVSVPTQPTVADNLLLTDSCWTRTWIWTLTVSSSLLQGGRSDFEWCFSSSLNKPNWSMSRVRGYKCPYPSRIFLSTVYTLSSLEFGCV